MAHYVRVSLGELIERLDARTGDTFWVHDEKRDAINEAIKVWQCLCGEWTTTMDQPVNATNENTYQVPKQICSLQKVDVNASALTMTALPEHDMGNPAWQGVSGTAAYWLPAGLNMVDLAPYPTSGTLTFKGLEEAPVLGTDGDFINVGDEQLTRLLDYAHHYLTIKEGTVELQSTLPLLAGMVEAAGKMNAHYRGSAIYKKFMGIYREASERPAELGTEAPGVRA